MDMNKRDEVRLQTAQLNASAVVALLERQNTTIKEFSDRLSAIESRISTLEQAEQQRASDKFSLMAAAMGSGPTP